MKNFKFKKKAYAVTLGILLNSTFLHTAWAADAPIEGPYEIDSDLNIDLSVGYFQGLHSPDASSHITVKPGESPIINITVSGHTDADAIHGLEAQNGGLIDLRGAEEVTLTGMYDSAIHALPGGEIIIGDHLTVDTGASHGATDTNGIGAVAGKVTIGNNADLLAAGNVVQATFDSEVVIGDNAKIVGELLTAVYSLDGSTIKIGDGAYLEAYRQTVSAGSWYTNDSGKIEIGDNATIITSNYSAVYGFNEGDIRIGDQARITGQSAGVQSQGSSYIEVGDRAIITGDTGADAYSDSEIVLGKDAQITGNNYGVVAVSGTITVGEGSVVNATNENGVWANNGGTVNLKDAVKVNARSTGIAAYEVNTEVNLGKSVQITSEEGNGIEAGQGSVVNADAGTAIWIKGNDVAGVLGYSGSQVNLNGATIQVDQADSYALYAADATSQIQGRGQYHIIGDLYSEDDGTIDLQMDPNSYLKGKLTINNNGRIDFGLENSRWDFTGESSLTHLNMVNSVVDMTHDSNAFNTLTTDNLSGSGGTFILDIDGGAVD